MRGTVISDRHEKRIETKLTKDLNISALIYAHQEILVSKVYKGFKNISKAIRLTDSSVFKVPVHTSQNGAQCGVKLTKNTKYLIMGHIMGDRLMISHCSFVREWDEVTMEIRHGISSRYDCGCLVNVCFDGYCDNQGTAGCKWNLAWDTPADECTIRYRSCHRTRTRENSKVMTCAWKRQSTQFKECEQAKMYKKLIMPRT